MEGFRVDVPNASLNAIGTARDVVTFFEKQIAWRQDNVAQATSTSAKLLARTDLPPNVLVRDRYALPRHLRHKREEAAADPAADPAAAPAS